MTNMISLVCACLVLSKLVFEMTQSDTPISTIAFIFVVASAITFLTSKGGDKHDKD